MTRKTLSHLKTLLNIYYAPFILYFILALTIIAAMLGLSWFLGEKGKGELKNTPYESGIKATESARLRFPSKFYLIAMFFVLFDIEAVFLYAWAVSFRESSWLGFTGASIFIGILLVLLIYELSTGALDFEISGYKILKAYKKKKKIR